MAKLGAWFVLEKPVNEEQSTTEKVLDTPASITKEGVLAIAENTPGIALIKQNGTDAYNTYKQKRRRKSSTAMVASSFFSFVLIKVCL